MLNLGATAQDVPLLGRGAIAVKSAGTRFRHYVTSKFITVHSHLHRRAVGEDSAFDVETLPTVAIGVYPIHWTGGCRNGNGGGR